MGQNFAEPSGSRSGSSGSKWLIISVVGVALIALVFVIVIWHPWQQKESSESYNVSPHTYSMPKEGTEKDVENQKDTAVYDAIDGWVGFDASSDMVKIDMDAGFLPMSEAFSVNVIGTDENGVPMTDNRENIVEVDLGNGQKVEKSIVRQHRWLEFASMSVIASEDTSSKDKGINIEFSGLAFNPMSDAVSAEKLPPIYVDGQPLKAYVANGSIGAGTSGGFTYRGKAESSEFDLVIYGFKTHVSIPEGAGNVGIDSTYGQVSYPLLDQEFVDTTGNRIRDTILGGRAVEALSGERDGKK